MADCSSFFPGRMAPQFLAMLHDATFFGELLRRAATTAACLRRFLASLRICMRNIAIYIPMPRDFDFVRMGLPADTFSRDDIPPVFHDIDD